MAAFALLAVFGTLFPSPALRPVAYAQTSAEERAKLEGELRQLENEIAQYQGQIATYQKQGKSLSGEIATLNAKISKLNLQIRGVNLKLADLSSKISATQVKIDDLESDIVRHEDNLSEILKTLYQTERTSTLEVLLRSARLTEFMNDVANISSVQDNLHQTIVEVKQLRDELAGQKKELTIAKADAETLKRAQESQKKEVDSTKGQKSQLLTVTKGKESEYQKLVKDRQARANEIRARLYTILGGGAMTFGQAYQYAKAAEGATGIRAALVLAVLSRESALGKNVGQCTYHRAMNPADHPAFFEITAKLGINPETQKVSCPNADGPYGGAMGPAQFIPRTWKSYEPRVSAILGRPASPWNNADAFYASALYLKDAGAASSERTAAAKYYCGGNWNRYVCTSVYGQAVVDKANQFQADIDLLEGRQ